MGVPAFFRWLSRKYPSVIIECVENKKIDPETEKNIYEDGTLPNPNGVEFDNLYLDMNGIIHPCTHPEDKPAPKNEDEMMVAIFECIDRLMNIVRPRKLLYMAIDGVAPRAKMNQQRSRRFRAAKESMEKRLEIERIRSELLAKGCILPPEKEKGEHFDSNCITPGTPFMERLSQCLNYYIHDRLNRNPGWRGLKVILSDANVPGEGEHKIMDYIRKQRSQSDHDPNTQHVLCGADADLIMLGLATHEPHFTIIREEFLPNKPKPCEICNQFGHEMDKCTGLNAASVSDINNFKPDVPIAAEVKYIFVRLSVLREYLKKTLEMHNLPFAYDFERVLDDWVFMCFFVGNDFLPHLPSLEIREGAVDRLIELYKRCIYRGKDYLTNSGEVKLEWVQLILSDLGKVEDQIFKDRQKREKMYKAREKSKRMRTEQYSSSIMDQSGSFKLTPLGRDHVDTLPYIDNYKQNAANFRNSEKHSSQEVKTQEVRSLKRTASKAQLDEVDEDEDEDVHDEVRLWEDGFKDRYYESKFDVGKDNLRFRYSVALQYVRGLCWVLKYYYQGCASWDWYFPYHYAPFASDFVNITGLSTTFAKDSKPFNPLEQLMSVFPAASSSHVPEPWANLMSDPNSDIIDFYPVDFKIDLNGKKFAWQGVALLPFVDEKRLFKALKPYYCKLTEDEIRRNKKGECRLYVGKDNTKSKFIRSQYSNRIFDKIPEVPIVIDGMRGTIKKSEQNIPLKETLNSPISGLHDVTENQVTTVIFCDPQYDKDFIFPAIRLPKAIDPPNVLAPADRPDNYRPTIGFDPNLPRAYVTQGGHRLLGNSLGLTRDESQQYNNDTSNSHYRQQPYNYTVQQRSYQQSNSSRGYNSNSRNHLQAPYSSYNSQQQRYGYNSNTNSSNYSHNYQQQAMQSMTYHNNYQNNQQSNRFVSNNRNPYNHTRNRDNNDYNNYNRKYN